MKKILALIALAGWGLAGISRGDLMPGNIAIIMANSDAPDSFAWVPFVDIPAGTVIGFTDSSFGTGDGGGITNSNFRWTEHLDAGGPLTWSNSLTLSAGTVVIFDGTSWNIGTTAGAVLGLGTAGDQIFAFTGSVASNPVPGQYSGVITGLMYGVQFSGGTWLTSGAGSTSASYLPSSLTSANVALGANDNWIYTGTRTGTPDVLLAAVNNPANWTSDNTTPFTWTAGDFTVVPEPGTAMLLIGGIGLCALARRRRSA